MKSRPAMLAVVLTASVGLALLEHGGPRWNAAEGWYLDFLVANARGRLEKEELAPAENVVFIGFNEKDKAEFSAWPPAPIDYIMALKKLKSHEPDTIAFSDVLKWDSPDVQFVDELQQLLVGFNQVALAFSATAGTAAGPGLAGDDAGIPSFARVEGESSTAPQLGRIVFPDARLSTQMQLGFVATRADSEAGAPTPLVARADARLVPSLAAQVIALQSRAPYASQRLRFGAGAGLYLDGDRFIPLLRDGTVRPRLKADVTRINALDLLTPDLGDAASKALSETLGRNKLIVLGISPSPGETHADVAAWALALPRLNRAPDYVCWMATLAAAALAVWQLRFGRWGAAIFGMLAATLLLGAALVVFESSFTWSPPLLPGIVLLAGTVFCFVWRRKA